MEQISDILCLCAWLISHIILYRISVKRYWAALAKAADAELMPKIFSKLKILQV